VARTCFTAVSTSSSSLRMRHKYPSSSLSELSCSLNAARPRPPSASPRIKIFSSPVVFLGRQIRTGWRKRRDIAGLTFERRLVRRKNRKTPLETEALQPTHGRVNGSVAPPSCREGGQRIPCVRKVVVLLTVFVGYVGRLFPRFRLLYEGRVQGDQIGTGTLFRYCM
jgi:hypothetical protein